MKYGQLSLIADTVGTSSSCPHYRESAIGGVYFCQISVIGVSTRQELTVLLKRYVLHFFIRTLEGRYIFFYKCMLGLITVVAMTSIMVSHCQ